MSDATVLDMTTRLEFAAILVAREDAFAALSAANARGVTGADLDAFMAAIDELDARSERLHRALWPRHRGRLVVAGGIGVLCSPTGRSSRVVWRRSAV